MKKIFNQYIMIIVTIISSIFVSSCEKEIDLDLRSVPPIVVIEGKILENNYPEVRVTMTRDFYDPNVFPPVEEAIVTVWDDAGNREDLALNSEGWFVGSTIKGAVGRTYNLSVTYDEKEYTSSSKMPPLIQVDSMSFFKFPIFDYPFPRIHFLDPPGEENQYYRFILYINGKRKKGGYTASAHFVDGTYINKLLPVFAENNEDDDPIKQDDIITVETLCIDKGTHDFFETLYDIEDSQNNPTTNIKGGALGYFSAYTQTTNNKVAKW